MEGNTRLNHALINSLVELETAAALRFWASEDRTAWKDEILRFAETKHPLQLKPLLAQSKGGNKTKPILAEVALLDDELIRIFCPQLPHPTHDQTHSQTSVKANTQQTDLVSGLFLSPGFWLNENWEQFEVELRSHLEAHRQEEKLVFRTGFFNNAADILMAAELGFTGIQIHVHTMDLFELQMAIELARDCKLCPIVSAATLKELELAIQTDAPHVGLCFFPGQNAHEHELFVQRGITQIPKDCTRILFASLKSSTELNYLSQLPFDCIFQLSAV